ncbi:MAG: EpsG family protein [Ruminococcaceae bacterium]|nr:EpsG family protein [Oscillospiraceae bacterium]
MRELLPVVLTSLILAVLSHYTSFYDRNGMRYARKEWVFYAILMVVMILFVGLRTRYNDTGMYRHAYNLIKSGDIFADVDWRIGNNPGYNVLTQLLVNLGMDVQSYLMFYAAITVGIYLWFIRKYSANLWLTVFLFVTVGAYTFALAAIKQCAAVAFALIGTDRAIQKKWISFVLWVLLGSMFHAYALMYLLVPLLMFKPWTKMTYWMLAAFGAAGVLMQPLMGTIISITTMLGEEYDAASFGGEGVNPFRLAVVAVPAVLAFMTRRVIWKKNDRVMNLMVNLVMLNAAIMFVALFGTANYFARLANYFLIFQCITIPWLFSNFDRETRKWLIPAAVVCYVAYFYYANVINQHFDSGFSSVTLMEWLRSLV